MRRERRKDGREWEEAQGEMAAPPIKLTHIPVSGDVDLAHHIKQESLLYP